jgi:hypothetical protein
MASNTFAAWGRERERKGERGMGRITDSHELATAAYLELMDQHGMPARRTLVKAGGTVWTYMDPDDGPVHLNYKEAVHIMAEDALAWVREDLNMDVELSMEDSERPAAILRRIRELAKTRTS